MPAANASMRSLDNRWYMRLVAGLQLDTGLFQIRRPADLPFSDAALWGCEDAVPPRSLVFDTAAGVRRFSDEYSRLVVGLAHLEDRFRRDVGEDVYRKWTAHLQLQPAPPPGQLPALFRQWAILNAPSALQLGVSRLVQATQAAGPVERLAAYRGAAAKTFDFSGTVADLVELGRNSPAGDFTFDRLATDGDVSGTWAAGEGLGRQGLWTGSRPDEPPSDRFAASEVTVRVRFRSCVVWAASPGTWYDSSFLNLAFSQHGTPPWPAQGGPTWAQVFGPGGSLCRLIAALVVLDRLDITVVSEAIYSAGDQDRIRRAAASGLWPFYIPSSGATASNSVRFGARMTIKTRTQPEHPVVVGDNVLDVARYLGHSGTGGTHHTTNPP